MFLCVKEEMLTVCESWSSEGGTYEYYNLLKFDAVYIGTTVRQRTASICRLYTSSDWHKARWRSHFLQSKHQTFVLRWITPRWKQHVSPKHLCPSTHFTASYFRRQQSSGYCSSILSLACPPFTFCKQFVCPHYHATPAERGRVLFRGCSPMVEAHCRYQ